MQACKREGGSHSGEQQRRQLAVEKKGGRGREGGGGMEEGREGRCIADGASSEDHVQALLLWPVCSDPVFWSAALPSFCHSLPKV